MNLPVLDLKNYTVHDQVDKVIEESSELLNAIIKGTKEERLEEALDVIQSTIHLIGMLATEEEFKIALERHYKKLADRGWNIKGHVNFSFEKL